MSFLVGLILCLFYLQHAHPHENSLSNIYLSSREGDPASLVENVSTIYGDYTEIEVDLVVPAPDTLILSRFYSSRDTLQTANFGGWRFNPHCFLTVRKDSKGKSYTNAEGRFELTTVYVGNPDGTILSYVGWQNITNLPKKSLYKIDPEEEVVGLANTAKGNINCWTNLKNNELYFNPQTDSFELLLGSEGRRFYVKHPSLDVYLITYEILPSGNKVFYDFDEKGQLTFIKETNSSEKKVLAWIKIEYKNGIHVDTSDGRTVDYQFQQDPSGPFLLTEATRSDKPNLSYQYQVVDNRALLLKKTLPEGRFVQIDYYTDKIHKNKVKSVTTPIQEKEKANIVFSYGDGYTEVEGPSDHRTVYRFDDNFQLVAKEQYLDGFIYRVHKKSWGTKSDVGNLISTSVEDASGNVFYHKHFTYDSKGNISEEREYGDVIGIGSTPLILDENGLVTNQDGHIKNYSYFSGKNTHGFFQADAKGTGVKYWYKKGTNLLLKKFILTNGSRDSEDENYYSGIKERHFYFYNEDAALIQVIVDDGKEMALKDDNGTERTVTYLSPKQELPNVGAPEVIEQKYCSIDGNSEFLLKRTVNQFDRQGNIISQAVYDANENHCYTLAKKYVHGLLVLETDPLGNEIHYSYDANQNLTLETNSATGASIEYRYDLRNRLINTSMNDRDGNRWKAQVAYDSAGSKLYEIDQFGNETIYVNDSLGRPVQITYPETSNSIHSSTKPTYSYAYDLFDNPITITDSKGRVLKRSYNVHGKPVEISHVNGTKEIYKYDSGGNLHYYCGIDGLKQVFAYDYKGRLNRLEYYKRGNQNTNYSFKEKTYRYGAFHKTSETDEKGKETTYTYDRSGRLSALNKSDQKVEFIYDSLSRTHGVKKWKSSNTFTLEIKEYDPLDRLIEDRIEDQSGKVLLKKRYIYNNAGQLAQIIGYPQNKESILLEYQYDAFGRLTKATNAAGHETTIIYDDTYINEWGQKTQKRTVIDPIGNYTEEVFEANDRLISVTKKDKSGQILHRSESSYDSLGNKIAEQVLVLSADEPSSTYVTEWSYNQGDQLESFTLGKGTPEERATRFEYNSYGDIVAKYNYGSKEPVTYRYNNEGNLDSISYKEEKKELEHRLTYDNCKNITEVYLDSSSKITYSFNAHDMPLTETIKDEFGSYQVSLIYDGEGKIKTLQLPDGSFVEYGYEGPFVKDVRRSSKDKKELYYYQVVSRDLMGNILEEILPGHLGSRKQFWDGAGRRTGIVTDFFEDRVPEGGYDPLENVRRRETVLNEKTYTIDYDYNALAQLILEKGEIEHQYVYDSIGNRLKRDSSIYKVNAINQLTETEDTVYTFNSNGNLATKTTGDKTWSFHSNHLNQIISITDPDKNVIKFTYDLNGKRLTKRIESKGKKMKLFRFFYLGETEIGCVDEKGVITELKIPSNPNNPEAPSIALEFRKDIYVPIYDLQGNIVRLLDHQKRKVIETYRYSAYGEEEIINAKGNRVSNSSIGNSWRYRGKRVDKEVGLIYFGYRYYDSGAGRWVSPDPAGSIDGPNLYTYARNNPMKYVDYFGLSTEFDENCGCTHHGHPGWHNAPIGCVCICGKNGSGFAEGGYRSKIGSDIKSAISGISHGVVDFVLGSIHDLQTAAAYIGSEHLDISLHERVQMIEAIEQSQANRMSVVDSWVMDQLSADPSDSIHQSFRSRTTTGLEVGSLVAGGYGAVKGVIAFNRLAKTPAQLTKVAKFVGQLKWPSPTKGRAVVNGIEYTAHALERMAPRGLIQSGTEIISRGVPPSVVENAINFGTKTLGNTPQEIVHVFENVRVVTNLDATKVITVITTGK